METDTPLYPRIADGFSRALRGVQADQWTRPTPCTDWTVRELVVHVIETHRRVRAIVVPRSEPVEVTDEELLGAWVEATNAILDAIADPELATTKVQTRSGEQPFSSLVAGLLSVDTLCHTWDLARATNQDEALDSDAVRAAHEFLAPIDDVVRVPGGFAPAIEPASDATDQTRFLNFAGRAV
jgi:uncharacterized protein (TIGR03086 family)